MRFPWYVPPCLAMVAMLLAGDGRGAAAGAGGSTRSTHGRVIRVLTYNMHHGEGLDGRIDLPRQAAILNRAGADLVALQEVDRGTARAAGVDQLAELARLTGMHAAFAKALDFQGGGYGVGILSRSPVHRPRSRRLPGSPGREPRVALTVDVPLDEAGPRVAFTTTHLDQGREAVDKIAQASYLAGALPHEEQPGILAGDMNTRPDTEPMQILGRRWTDTFLEPPPEAGQGRRRRIDYVLVAPAAQWRTVESGYVDAPLASDHQPVLAVLAWLGEERRARGMAR